MLETRIHAIQLHLHRDHSLSLFPLKTLNVVINTCKVVGTSQNLIDSFVVTDFCTVVTNLITPVWDYYSTCRKRGGVLNSPHFWVFFFLLIFLCFFSVSEVGAALNYKSQELLIKLIVFYQYFAGDMKYLLNPL